MIEECQVCRSFVAEERPNAVCQICLRRTCHNCQRICDKCLETVCMRHIRVYEVWKQGQFHLFKLCDKCKDVKDVWK